MIPSFRRRYADLGGYHGVDPKDDAALERWRTGLSAANPREAQDLVREIDDLRWRLQGARDAIEALRDVTARKAT